VLSVLRPQLAQQFKELNLQREKMGNLHREDMDTLVAETTFVTIIVLGVAILVGILLSLFFARHILRRIQVLSDSAARITRGEFCHRPRLRL
jgi:nitrogen fixation/metabolism regulation signal transduction histidine kinase